MKPTVAIFTLFLCITGNIAFSQQYFFEHYTIKQGLSSLNINHIFQDSKGYIWVATQGGGVNRFDGKNFTHYTRKQGLINNDVTYIHEDKKGKIWIGTASGASCFNGMDFKNYNAQNGFTNGTVYAILNHENQLFFATQDSGILIFDGKKFKAINGKNGLNTNEAYCIAKDTEGSLYFGVSNGIVQYQKNSFTFFHQYPFINNHLFFSSYTDSKGQVWMGSNDGVLLKIDQQKNITQIVLPTLSTNDFLAGITEDKENNIWVAADHGLIKFNQNNKPQLINHAKGFSDNIAQSITCDYEGNIWAGTLGDGLYQLTHETIRLFNEKSGFRNKNINTICENDNQTYFVGTNEGLYFFNHSAESSIVKKLITNTEADNKSIACLAINNKQLWAGSENEIFIFQINNEALIFKNKINKVNNKKIISPTQIIFDNQQNAWISTYGSGLIKLQNTANEFDNKVMIWDKNTALQSDKILAVYKDDIGKIWIGTQDKGIAVFQNSQFSFLPNTASLSAWNITQSATGNIYWCSAENGVYEYSKNGITKKITEHNATDIVYNATNNSLILSSEQGLFQYNLSLQNNSTTLKKMAPVTSMNHHGLLLSNGNILAGTTTGLCLIQNNKNNTNNIAPKIYLHDIKLFYEKPDWKKMNVQWDSIAQLPTALALPYNKNHITFHIQAFTTKPVQYSFILEGYDEKWTTLKDNNEITYSNIEAGNTYTFKAYATNINGIKSSNVISYTFKINAPWWQTIWFKILVFLLAAISIFLLIYFRERNLKAKNLQLENIVQQRTEQIIQQKKVVETTLHEKENLLHEKELLLKEIHHRVKNNLQTISSLLMLQSNAIQDEQAKKAIAESQSRVSSIALVHQKLYQSEGIEKVMLHTFIEDLSKQIKFMYAHASKNIIIQHEINEIPILMDTAIPMGLIINELLTNSFKYAFNESNQNGYIHIAAQYKSKNDSAVKTVEIIYKDSGTGFNPLLFENTNTLGLKLIKLLSHQIGASVQYQNNNESIFTFTWQSNI